MIQIIYPAASGTLQTIELVDLSQSHDMSALPTDSPVERGVTISDHLRPELDRISIKAFVSNTPTRADSVNAAVSPSRAGSVSLGSGSATVLTFDNDFDLVQSVYDQLLYIKNTSTLCAIVTDKRRFESMAIISVSFPFDYTDAAEVSIEAREVRVVETQTAAAPRPTVIRGNPRTNAGHQGTNTSTATVNESAAHAGVRTIAGWLS